ncbi:transposase [Brevibacterium sp. JNUCC-42]|nr:transposase [Brevibacterium sp. JNUCC-42]
MVTKVHYPAETKWKAVQMREEGYSRREVMETLGIRNVTQLKTWMKWYRNGETHRFHQPVGKQYPLVKVRRT